MSGWDVTFLPFVGWPLFWGACAVAIILGAALIYLNRRGWPLRVAGLALVLAALANPILNTDERQQLSDIVAVIVDDSASQNIGNRRQQSEDALKEVQNRISTMANTEMRIGRTLTGTTPDTDGTRVFAALVKSHGRHSA